MLQYKTTPKLYMSGTVTDRSNRVLNPRIRAQNTPQNSSHNRPQNTSQNRPTTAKTRKKLKRTLRYMKENVYRHAYMDWEWSQAGRTENVNVYDRQSNSWQSRQRVGTQEEIKETARENRFHDNSAKKSRKERRQDVHDMQDACYLEYEEHMQHILWAENVSNETNRIEEFAKNNRLPGFGT